MSPLEISEINFRPTRQINGHIGFVSFVFNGFKIDNVAVYTRLNALPNESLYRLNYPVTAKGYPTCWPITKDTGDTIEKDVSSYIENLLNNL